jgi:dTDP-3-amino-3,4,6-trideoxy-alpha-D-glucose transaminase
MQRATPGRNSRLDEIQAAVLRVKLRHLDEWNKRRQDLADLYLSRLSSNTKLELPLTRITGSHVYHLYVVQHPERDSLQSYLMTRGIETMTHYSYLLHQQPLFRRQAQQPLPNAERVASRVLSLPLFPQLRRAEVLSVTDAIFDFERGV